ncbi:MAG: diguanylate cyclase [Parasporobacterium sp.]|nr:diguanylate cyclase [Parasporobacterium sp.]
MIQLINFWLIVALSVVLFVLSVRTLAKKKPESAALFWFFITTVLINIFFILYTYSDNLLLIQIGKAARIICWNFCTLALYCSVCDVVEFKHRFHLQNPLLIIACIDNALLLTNPLHYMYYAPTTGNEVINTFDLISTAGPFMYFHVVWNSAVIVLSLLIILYKIFKTNWIYRNQYISMFIVGLIGVTVSYLLTLTNLTFDFSKYAVSFIEIWFYFYLFYYKKSFTMRLTRKAAFDEIENAIVVFDDLDKLIDYNEAAREYFGIDESYLREYTFEEFFAEKLNLDIPDDSSDKKDQYLEFNNSESIFRITYRRIYDSKNNLVAKMVICVDVTEVKHATEKIEMMQKYDEKTGFYNRECFFNKLKELEAQRILPVTICVYNTNGLKLFNDLYGPEKGDLALKHIADVVRDTVPPDTFVARFDGDDTALIFTDRKEQDIINMMEIIKEKIMDNPFDKEGTLSIEFGIFTNRIVGGSLSEAYKVARNSMIKKKMLESESSKSALLNALMAAISQRDIETHNHEERSKEIARIIAKEMNMSYAETSELELLAVLHDIGKITIAERILHKPGPLDEDEWTLMRQHSEKGYYIAKASPELSSIAMGILCHHERWDGKGYPNGFKEEQIPLIARVVSVIDSFDVMTHDRPYKKAMPVEDAVKELNACKGSQFDPDVVDCFVNAINSGKIMV